MPWRRSVNGWLLAVALLALGGPAAAGGFGGTTILRTAPAGTEIRVGDIAARGSGVVVGWQENARGGGKAVYIRRSSNGGTTFRTRVRLDERPNRDIQVDVCGSWAWATSVFKEAGDWLVGLDKRALVGPFYERAALTTGGLSRRPDVACAGERLVVVWFQKVAGVWRVKLHAIGVHDSPKGDSLPEIDLDLGLGDMNKGLAIAGTAHDVYIAWFRGDATKFRHYAVEDGPDHDLSGIPTAALPDLPDGFGPKIGAGGDRVVLAYTNKADLRARVSTNAAVSWGPEKTLENMPFPSEVAAFAGSADVIGSRIVVAGTIVGGVFEDFSGEGFVDRTTNDGGAWARVPGSTKQNGSAVAAYRGTAGSPIIVEAWDKWIADPPVDKLRFQTQS